MELVCTTDDPVDIALRASPCLQKKKVSKQKYCLHGVPTKQWQWKIPQNTGLCGKTLKVSRRTIKQIFRPNRGITCNATIFLASAGCKLSDHGIGRILRRTYTQTEIDSIFNKVYGGKELSQEEILKFKSAMLHEGAVMDWGKGWTQQFHYGPIRKQQYPNVQEVGTRY